VAPHLFNLNTRWRWVVSLTNPPPPPRFSRERKNFRCTFCVRLVGQPKASLNAVDISKIQCCCLNLNSNISVVYLVVYLLYRLRYLSYYNYMGTAVAQWLRCCATNRKVAGSIPVDVSGFFFDITLPIALWPWCPLSL